MIALPSSPGKVVPVRGVAGREIYQSYIGSSANPGLRDFAIAAMIVDGKQVGSPYKSMQVDFYQRVTGIGTTNKNLQVNAS